MSTPAKDRSGAPAAKDQPEATLDAGKTPDVVEQAASRAAASAQESGRHAASAREYAGDAAGAEDRANQAAGRAEAAGNRAAEAAAAAAGHRAGVTNLAERAEASARVAGEQAEGATKMCASASEAAQAAQDAARLATEARDAAARHADRAEKNGASAEGDALAKNVAVALDVERFRLERHNAKVMQDRQHVATLETLPLRCRVARRHVQFPPILLPNNCEVALRYNPRQDTESPDNPEATVPYDGHRDLRTGVSISVPAGYEAIVTCLGRRGERLVIGHLVGDHRDEYVARVYNLSGGFMTIKAGEECCRVVLRRLPLVELEVLDIDGRPVPPESKNASAV